jgi:hypothetical protein
MVDAQNTNRSQPGATSSYLSKETLESAPNFR